MSEGDLLPGVLQEMVVGDVVGEVLVCEVCSCGRDVDAAQVEGWDVGGEEGV